MEYDPFYSETRQHYKLQCIKTQMYDQAAISRQVYYGRADQESPNLKVEFAFCQPVGNRKGGLCCAHILISILRGIMARNSYLSVNLAKTRF